MPRRERARVVQWSVVSEARTTTIRRPSSRAASDHGRSRLADRRRPIAAAFRIAPERRHRLLFGTGAVVIATALAAAFFVLPVRAWFRQDDRLAERRAQLSVLQRVNAELQVEVDRLQTDAGVREAARQELGYIAYGEVRLTSSDRVLLPDALPAGWPYDPITQIFQVRTTQAQGGFVATPTPSVPAVP